MGLMREECVSGDVFVLSYVYCGHRTQWDDNDDDDNNEAHEINSHRKQRELAVRTRHAHTTTIWYANHAFGFACLCVFCECAQARSIANVQCTFN